MEKDMAICLVIFNPVNSKRILMNYHYVVNEFKLQELPLFTLELVYEGRTPQIADAIHVYTKSYMFHKENLCRVIEKYVPENYTKLAFIDADILFSDSSWYSKTSKLLEDYDVVQPFEKCNWLDLTYKNVMTSKKTFVLADKFSDFSFYHEGFAWCFRRDYYNQVGFLDESVIGSGDSFSAYAWKMFNYFGPDTNSEMTTLMKPIYDKYYKLPKPSISYLSGIEINHLYHGNIVNRQYKSRYTSIFSGNTKPIEDLIVKNRFGVYEWKDISIWNPKFLDFFRSRDDDSLSNINNEITVTKNENRTIHKLNKIFNKKIF